MSNYDGKIELPQMYGEEKYLSSDKPDAYLWLAEENTKQTKKIERLQEQLKEANKLLRYCCANYESSRFGATITEDGEILPKGPVWNYLKKWKV